jgi:hypothetical protein
VSGDRVMHRGKRTSEGETIFRSVQSHRVRAKKSLI